MTILVEAIFLFLTRAKLTLCFEMSRVFFLRNKHREVSPVQWLVGTMGLYQMDLVFWLHNTLAEMWGDFVITLCLDFFTCKMGII